MGERCPKHCATHRQTDMLGHGTDISTRTTIRIITWRPNGMPGDLQGVRYYAPTDNGHEAMLTKRLAMIRNLLKKR